MSLTMSPFTKILLLIIFYTMAFPAGLVASFSFALSVYLGGYYILGSVYSDAGAALISGYVGVLCFTRLWNLRTLLKDLNKR